MSEALREVFAILDRATTAQLEGQDARATYWNWQLVKLARRTKDVRVKRAAVGSAAYYHGFIAYRHHDYAKAERLFCHAIGLGISNDWAYMNAGCAIRDQGRVEEALAFFERAVAARPDAVQPLVALGNSSFEMGLTDAAAIAWSRALAVETDDPAAVYDQAILSLTLGQYGIGWQKHHARWAAPIFRSQHRPPGTPEWDGAPTPARLLLFAEQGNGDAIMLLRWLPWALARAPRAVLAVHRPLVALCEHVWPDLEVHPLEAMPEHEQHLSLFDLPMVAGCESVADLPIATWAKAPGRSLAPTVTAPRPRIGLVWAGGRGTHHDWRRSVPWAAMRPLLATPGTFVCLQTERLEDLTAEDRAQLIIPTLTDWADTARWLESLDLLIGVDTGVAHLAGALGVPTWLLLPRLPDYRWGLFGESTPWYPWHRLYRQEVAQDWAGPIARVSECLERLQLEDAA